MDLDETFQLSRPNLDASVDTKIVGIRAVVWAAVYLESNQFSE